MSTVKRRQVANFHAEKSPIAALVALLLLRAAVCTEGETQVQQPTASPVRLDIGLQLLTISIFSAVRLQSNRSERPTPAATNKQHETR